MKLSTVLIVILSIIAGFALIIFNGTSDIIEKISGTILLDGMLISLLIMMCLDILTGLITAQMGRSPNTDDGKFSKKVFVKGLVSKGMILIVISLAIIVNFAVHNNMIRDIVTLFYILEEGFSILENCTYAGVPIPNRLKKILSALEEDIEKSEDT